MAAETVMPAQAGMQGARFWLGAVHNALDPRLRGDDGVDPRLRGDDAAVTGVRVVEVSFGH